MSDLEFDFTDAQVLNTNVCDGHKHCIFINDEGSALAMTKVTPGKHVDVIGLTAVEPIEFYADGKAQAQEIAAVMFRLQLAAFLPGTE